MGPDSVEARRSIDGSSARRRLSLGDEEQSGALIESRFEYFRRLRFILARRPT